MSRGAVHIDNLRKNGESFGLLESCNRVAITLLYRAIVHVYVMLNAVKPPLGNIF